MTARWNVPTGNAPRSHRRADAQTVLKWVCAFQHSYLHPYARNITMNLVTLSPPFRTHDRNARDIPNLDPSGRATSSPSAGWVVCGLWPAGLIRRDHAAGQVRPLRRPGKPATTNSTARGEGAGGLLALP